MQVVTHIGDESAGPSYSVPSLCSALQRNGCDVTLYTLKDLPNKTFDFEVKAFPMSRFPTLALGRSPLLLKALLEDAVQYDLIHSHMLWTAPNYYSGFAAIKHNKPYLIAPRGTLSKWALERAIWKKKIVLALGQKKALNAVSCFHSTAEEERIEIAQYGYPDIPCAILPNGIHLPPPPTFRKNNLKKKLVFLSRIHPKKGVDILVRVWRQLQNRFTDWELAIVGANDNKYAIQMKELSRKLECERINFTGEIKGDKKIEFLQKSHLFVLPTHSENFGMVVAEALSCNLPVICTKGAPWKGLESHNAGWWIDIGEEPLEKALINAMSQSVSSLQIMGENGRSWMDTDYSWDGIAIKTIEVYNWLLERSDKPNNVL